MPASADGWEAADQLQPRLAWCPITDVDGCSSKRDAAAAAYAKAVELFERFNKSQTKRALATHRELGSSRSGVAPSSPSTRAAVQSRGYTNPAHTSLQSRCLAVLGRELPDLLEAAQQHPGGLSWLPPDIKASLLAVARRRQDMSFPAALSALVDSSWRALDVSSTPIPPAALLAALQQLPDLRCLDVTSCAQLSAHHLQQAAHACPRLEVLRLGGSQALSGAAAEALPALLPRLRGAAGGWQQGHAGAAAVAAPPMRAEVLQVTRGASKGPAPAAATPVTGPPHVLRGADNSNPLVQQQQQQQQQQRRRRQQGRSKHRQQQQQAQQLSAGGGRQGIHSPAAAQHSGSAACGDCSHPLPASQAVLPGAGAPHQEGQQQQQQQQQQRVALRLRQEGMQPEQPPCLQQPHAQSRSERDNRPADSSPPAAGAAAATEAFAYEGNPNSPARQQQQAAAGGGSTGDSGGTSCSDWEALLEDSSEDEGVGWAGTLDHDTSAHLGGGPGPGSTSGGSSKSSRALRQGRGGCHLQRLQALVWPDASLQVVALVLERCPRVAVVPLMAGQLAARGVELTGWWEVGRALDEEAWQRVGPGALLSREDGTPATPRYSGPSLAEKFKQAYVEQDERLQQVAVKMEAYQMRRALESSGGRRVLESWLDEV